MHLSDKIKRFFRKFNIDGLTLYLVVTIFIIWAVDFIFPNLAITSYLDFSRHNILHGQVWRLVTFLFMPPAGDPISMLLFMYFYYFIGTNLESYWGSAKFTRYFFTGAALLIAGGFITGYAYSEYLYLTMFISYALLAPNHQFMFLFFIPVKAKYLAILDGIIIAAEFVGGSPSVKSSVAACAVLILIFFGSGIISRIKAKKRFRDFKKNFDDR